MVKSEQVRYNKHNMQYEVTSLNTKRMISASLKKMMLQKTLSKITVSEIIEDCGINRKTFYYHFADIYALLKWTFEQEAFDVVSGYDLMQNYRDAVIFAMDYISDNKQLINNCLSAIERDDLRNLFYSDFYTIINGAVTQCIKLHAYVISEDFVGFLSRMYTGIIAELIISWVQGGYEKDDKQKTLEYICTIFNEMLPYMLLTAQTRKL